MTFLKISTDKSCSSLVIPLRDKTTFDFANTQRGNIASRNQPIDLVSRRKEDLLYVSCEVISGGQVDTWRYHNRVLSVLQPKSLVDNEVLYQFR